MPVQLDISEIKRFGASDTPRRDPSPMADRCRTNCADKHFRALHPFSRERGENGPQVFQNPSPLPTLLTAGFAYRCSRKRYVREFELGRPPPVFHTSIRKAVQRLMSGGS